MKNINWNDVEDLKEFTHLPAGGYICKITAVNDVSDKEYLKVEYDIAKGDFKGYYDSLYKSKGFWGASFIRSYKTTALSFFKAFITAVEKSNTNFKFNNDEKTLVDKYIGLVLAEEEYKANDGNVKTRLYVASVHSADKINKNEFAVPPIKKLQNTDDKWEAFTAADSIDNEKLPWE